MFVVATNIANNHALYRWADKSQFPELFTEQTNNDGKWMYSLICDDHEHIDRGSYVVSDRNSWIFYAKDKETLRDGLKSVGTAAKIDAKECQLAVFCGSYDFVEVAGWGRNKIKAVKGWDNMKKQGETVRFKEQGLSKSDFITHMNRLRLMKRGYFAIVGITTQMSRMQGSRPTHGSEMMIRILGHWVS